MKKVLIIIAPENYQDYECFIPKEEFEKAGASITIASSKLGLRKGSLGGTIESTVLLHDVKVKDYDVIMFVGGMGAPVFFDNIDAHRIAKEAVSYDKIISAICIAPVILARAGILKGKNATVFPSGSDELIKAEASYTGSNVTVDGKIITANGPKAAKRFAEEIIKKIN